MYKTAWGSDLYKLTYCYRTYEYVFFTDRTIRNHSTFKGLIPYQSLTPIISVELSFLKFLSFFCTLVYRMHYSRFEANPIRPFKKAEAQAHVVEVGSVPP